MLLMCDPSYSLRGWVGVLEFCFRPSPTPGVGGGSMHVALFMHTVFHINLFQLEYYMSVRYKRANIINLHYMPSFLKDNLKNRTVVFPHTTPGPVLGGDVIVFSYSSYSLHLLLCGFNYIHLHESS